MNARDTGNERTYLIQILPLIILFGAVKLLQVILYPHPYVFPDSLDYIGAAISGETDPNRPFGYSAALQLMRALIPLPIGVGILQALIRLIAVLYLGWVLRRGYDFSVRATGIILAILLLNPLDLMLDHYVLSDSLFVSTCIGFTGAMLRHARSPDTSSLIVGGVSVTVAVWLRFVGIALPALWIVVVGLHLYPRRSWRGLGGALAIPAIAVGSVLLVAAKTSADLGVFRYTTFDGRALFGNVASILRPSDLEDLAIDDPEAHLMVEYLAAFPSSTFTDPDHDSDWYRWDAQSPPRRLIRAFGSADVRDLDDRDREFVSRFETLVETPRTSARRYSVRVERDATMDTRHATVLVNELLRRFNRAYMRRHASRYLTHFYPRSLALLFRPRNTMLYDARYAYRPGPDAVVTAFWPGSDTSTWRPRSYDVWRRFPWLPEWLITGMWGLSLGLLGVFVHRRRRAESLARILRHTGPLVLMFGVAFGVAIAFAHPIKARYVSPVMVFVLTGAALIWCDRPGLSGRPELRRPGERSRTPPG